LRALLSFAVVSATLAGCTPALNAASCTVDNDCLSGVCCAGVCGQPSATSRDDNAARQRPDATLPTPHATLPDAAIPECAPNARQRAACGLNVDGTQSRDCVHGQWTSLSPCIDPDVCVDGTGGIVARGADGRWSRPDDC